MKLRILVYPFDEGPYQELLYREMRTLGANVRYLKGPTPSATANLLLTPLVLAMWRARGYRVLHLHWVWPFRLPRRGGGRALPRLMQLLFGWWLGWSKRLGFKIVWTAHNLLPHAPVFYDDVAARRTLLGAADLVLVHSVAAGQELRRMTGVPFKELLLPLGPYSADLRSADAVRDRYGVTSDERLLSFFGVVQPYKGVADLLEAFTSGPIPGARLLVVGDCPDPLYRRQLEKIALVSPGTVRLQFGRVSDSELAEILAAADLVVLPFREVTTSGSLQLALSMGRPVLIPDLSAFEHLPSDAVLRYDGSVTGLRAALVEACGASVSKLGELAKNGQEFAARESWSEIARNAMAALSGLFDIESGVPAHRPTEVISDPPRTVGTQPP
jgi:glycosyltransferase involved in cell wall biosynthesis